MANKLKLLPIEIEAKAKVLEAQMEIVSRTVLVHANIIENLISNPHMQGATDSLKLIAERAVEGKSQLEVKVAEFVAILAKAGSLATETQAKYHSIFTDIADNPAAADDFNTAEQVTS
jgi:hypothetical protein